MALPSSLRKDLSLLDVYVISTGAMIGSGFFLLPGLAVSHSGPGVVLAYALAGVLIIPAMLSQAELATAMPKAGGAYYFLDRTLGPLVGTIGGFGSWLALVLKSAFALIGMGAYVALVFEIPALYTAFGFTFVFCMLNVFGARESSGLIRVLVTALLVILLAFLVTGMLDLARGDVGLLPRNRFTPLLPNGVDGLLETVGLVFISYVGLTNVASLAEEVKDPERNIPLGMMLALGTVTVVYVIGVYIMVAVVGSEALSTSLTPVADTAAAFDGPLPSRVAMWVMVIAATVAFASMANAGILAASRYPLAMARDHILPGRFAHIGRFGTPTVAVLLTCGLLAGFLFILNVEQVAKLASSLQLLLFGLINVAVIVMRESGIESYDPGFRSPGYPFVQLVGLFVPLVLVAEMGWLPVLFTAGVTALCFVWYTYYARHRIARDGAIYHVFERLGRRRFAGLDRELRDIMKEKGARADDPFDEVVAEACVIDLPDVVALEAVIRHGSSRLAERLPLTTEELTEVFQLSLSAGPPVAHGAALLHSRIPNLDRSELALVRARRGISIGDANVHAVFMLVSGDRDPGRHLRILAQLAGRVEDPGFVREWLESADEQELKELLLRDDRFLSLRVHDGTSTGELIGRTLQDLAMPEGSLVAIIRRRGVSIVPRGATALMEGDRLTIIGDSAGLRELAARFGVTWP